MKNKVWTFDPHIGGNPVPADLKKIVCARLLIESDRLGLSKKATIKIRFRGTFCYVDAIEENNSFPTHLFRLRYFSNLKKWSVSFFTYSNDAYSPCFFPTGEMLGDPEEAMPLASVYL